MGGDVLQKSSDLPDPLRQFRRIPDLPMDNLKKIPFPQFLLQIPSADLQNQFPVPCPFAAYPETIGSSRRNQQNFPRTKRNPTSLKFVFQFAREKKGDYKKILSPRPERFRQSPFRLLHAIWIKARFEISAPVPEPDGQIFKSFRFQVPCSVVICFMSCCRIE